MANLDETIAAAREIQGTIAVAVVDASTGMTLSGDAGEYDLDLSAAGSTDVLRAMQRTLDSLGGAEPVEDIFVTTGNQFHLIRPTSGNPALFLYQVLDRDRANLALARLRLAALEKELTL